MASSSKQQPTAAPKGGPVRAADGDSRALRAVKMARSAISTAFASVAKALFPPRPELLTQLGGPGVVSALVADAVAARQRAGASRDSVWHVCGYDTRAVDGKELPVDSDARVSLVARLVLVAALRGIQLSEEDAIGILIAAEQDAEFAARWVLTYGPNESPRAQWPRVGVMPRTAGGGTAARSALAERYAKQFGL